MQILYEEIRVPAQGCPFRFDTSAGGPTYLVRGETIPARQNRHGNNLWRRISLWCGSYFNGATHERTVTTITYLLSPAEVRPQQTLPGSPADLVRITAASSRTLARNLSIDGLLNRRAAPALPASSYYS